MLNRLFFCSTPSASSFICVCVCAFFLALATIFIIVIWTVFDTFIYMKYMCSVREHADFSAKQIILMVWLVNDYGVLCVSAAVVVANFQEYVPDTMSQRIRSLNTICICGAYENNM